MKENGSEVKMRQVILIPDETGGYVVEVPSLPGCFSQGETVEEALASIKEAIELHIADMIDAGELSSTGDEIVH
jgi:predicted RNase H-like HicB family nuclease